MVNNLNEKTELELITIAQTEQSDEIANAAMKLLKKKFDYTYMFCNDCDGAVVKESLCCMNQKPNFIYNEKTALEIKDDGKEIINELEKLLNL